MAMDSYTRDVIFSKFVDGSIPDVRSFQPVFAKIVRRNFPMERFCLAMDQGYDSIQKIEQPLHAGTKFTLAMRTTLIVATKKLSPPGTGALCVRCMG